jgi:hypothetical protein
MTDLTSAGQQADALIATEVAIQDRMWGDANERADAQNNQLLSAGRAQLDFLDLKLSGVPSDLALATAKDGTYPPDWDATGFRDYGSNVANLVVAAAFIRSEIKRRVLAGEDTTRAKRGQPYVVADPYMSSETAAEAIKDKTA